MFVVRPTDGGDQGVAQPAGQISHGGGGDVPQPGRRDTGRQAQAPGARNLGGTARADHGRGHHVRVLGEHQQIEEKGGRRHGQVAGRRNRRKTTPKVPGVSSCENYIFSLSRTDYIQKLYAVTSSSSSSRSQLGPSRRSTMAP